MGWNYLSIPKLQRLYKIILFMIILTSEPISHYSDVIMGAVASQSTSLTIVYSTVDSDADQRKHQSSASLAFVRGSHQGPVNSPHKWPVTRKIFPFDDVVMPRRLFVTPGFAHQSVRLSLNELGETLGVKGKGERIMECRALVFHLGGNDILVRDIFIIISPFFYY